jgi:hypothetical protein
VKNAEDDHSLIFGITSSIVSLDIQVGWKPGEILDLHHFVQGSHYALHGKTTALAVVIAGKVEERADSMN